MRPYRLIALTALLPLLACPPTREDGTGDCGDGGDGTLRVCANWGPDTPLSDGIVEVRDGPESVSLETPTDAEGCAEFDLAAGPWQWRVLNAFGDCISAFEAVDVLSCEDTLREINISNWCFDGIGGDGDGGDPDGGGGPTPPVGG